MRIPVEQFAPERFFGEKIQTIKCGHKERYVKCWAAFDTETYADPDRGYIVFWSCCLDYAGRQITIYGRTAESVCDFLDRISCALDLAEDRRLPFYVHNFSYDYVFLRNFLLDAFGEPVRSLATKSHRYLSMMFANGIEFKDSYVLAQSSLEKWASDLHAPVQKAVGQWDYEILRTPETVLTPDEIDYACRDAETLCLCVQLKAAQGSYSVGSIPLTATGFARDDARKAAFDSGWKKVVHRYDMTLPLYDRCSHTFWGGMTHGNRFEIARVLQDLTSFDFASSYPAVMCQEKFPAGKWLRAHYTIRAMEKDLDDYCFLFDLALIGVHVKPGHPMPCIPQSKCTRADKGAVWDNGKLISADAIIIPCTEVDYLLYMEVYDAERVRIGLLENEIWQDGAVYTCDKDFLPAWFTETIQHYFYLKTTKKGTDPQQYQFGKSLLNSQYGMTAQRIIRVEIRENFQAAGTDDEWKSDDPADPAGVLAEHYNKYNYFLPYQWCMYVTAWARLRLFRLGSCCREWIYCDTDSVKGRGWDLAAVEQYNADIREKNAERGIKPVEWNGKQYEMGIAEHDADYSEFITLGAKRYCSRDARTGMLAITVAGVPKAGVSVLQDDIYKFARGLVFHDTGKLLPEYHTCNGIRTEIIQGTPVRIGSWINLAAADYALDMTDRFDTLLDLPEDGLQ